MPPIDQTEGAETQPQNQDELDLSAGGGAGDSGAAQGSEEGAAANDGTDSEGGETDEGDDELVITLGDEPADEDEEALADLPPLAAVKWAKMRVQLAAEKRARKEAERKVMVAPPIAAPEIVVGDEPTFEGCEFDPDKFKAATLDWVKRKQEVEVQQTSRSEAQKAEQQRWAGRISDVNNAAKKLKIMNHDDVVANFDTSELSLVQRGLLVGAPPDPDISAKLRFVFARGGKTIKDIGTEQDPARFLWRAAELYFTKLNMTTRKPAPVPERRVSGNVAGAAAVDNTLNRLREEAAKTGNHSKVIAYKNAQRKKAAARA